MVTSAVRRLLVGSFDPVRDVGVVHEVTRDSALVDVLEGPWDVKLITASSDRVWIRPEVGALVASCSDVADWKEFRFPDEGYPGGMHFAFGSLWAVNLTKGAVWRIDPAQMQC